MLEVIGSWVLEVLGSFGSYILKPTKRDGIIGTTKDMLCPFCDSDIKDRTIIYNDYARVFPSNRAIGPCHLLITPLRHVALWDALTPEEQAAIFDLLKKIKLTLKEAYSAEGFNIAWNEGVVAGQSVPHFHLHVIPRRTGDTGITEYDPRNFLYRPEKWKELSNQTLVEIKQRLQKD
ncbi:MAG: HIT domain-containing protein [bacterium]|nr:HIT domain-containing protein [bacterium]